MFDKVLAKLDDLAEALEVQKTQIDELVELVDRFIENTKPQEDEYER